MHRPVKPFENRFQDGEFKALSHQQLPGQTRWYASVQATGSIQIGDEVEVLNEVEPTGNP